jgi:hypothetical protein
VDRARVADRRWRTLYAWPPYDPRGLVLPGDERLAALRRTIRGDVRGAAFMPSAGYQSTLISAQSDGTAVTGVAAGSLVPAAAKYTLPANYFDFVGKKLRVRAAGRISNIVTTPGTITFDIRFGAVTVAASSAMQLNAVAKTNVTWVLDWAFDARIIGAVAQLMHIGVWQSESVVGSPVPGTGGSGQLMVPTSAPAVGTAFDSTVAQVVDFRATFSLTGNSITLHQYALESMN